MKTFKLTFTLSLTLLASIQAQANFGNEDFAGDALPSTPIVTNSFLGAGTVRNLLCDNPPAPRCITEIKDGIWKTSVPVNATFVQSSIFQYVPPFDQGFDLTQNGNASALDIRIKSTGQAFFGFLVDIYAPEMPANKAKPSVSFNSKSLNTGCAWQVINVPFSAVELQDGATSFNQVLSRTHGMSFGVLIAGAGNTLEIDYIRSVSNVPEVSTALSLVFGIGSLLYNVRVRKTTKSEI